MKITIVSLDRCTKGLISFDEAHNLDGFFFFLHFLDVQIVDIRKVGFESGLREKSKTKL